jgi:PAS domain S-box-containing protein
VASAPPASSAPSEPSPRDAFDEVFEFAPVGMSLVSPDRRYLRVNRRYCEITGYTSEELCALPSLDALAHPDDREIGPPEFRKLVRGEIPRFAIYKRYVRRDGALIWTHLRVSLRRNPDGSPREFIGVLEDVTAQLEATAKLAVVSEQPFLGLAITQDDRTVYSNEAVAKISGHSQEETLSWRTADALALIHPEDRAFVAENARRRQQGDASARDAFRVRFLRGADEHRWIDVHVRPVMHLGRPATLFAYADVTEQVEAERALEEKSRRYQQLLEASQRDAARIRESEERYRGLVESLDEIVYATDFDRRLTFVNQAVAQLGYTPADLIGTSAAPLIHPDDRQLVAEAHARVLAGATLTMEYRLLDARGLPHLVRSTGRPMHDDAGRLIGLSGVMVDLSRERSLEEQLRVSQKMEAIERLAGGVAHDFNNLLTVIESYAQLAAESMPADDPLASDLLEIRRAAERAAILTRQLLAFSRKSILRPEVLDVSEVVVAVEKMLRRLIGEDVALAVTTGETSPVRADRGQLEQVLMNLAVNARDAMPDGGRLEIATADVELDDAQALEPLGVKPGPYVRITVTDTGCGMDEATLSRIFEPFYTTKAPGKGTGLGLATVYGIVKQSDGAIRVRSEVGRGTTFEIDLPRADHVVVAESPRCTTSPRAVGRETILVVEDEADVRVLVKRLLASAGFAVLTAASPKEAEALFVEHGASVDLLLTDVVMPGMNGRVLAERLRAARPSLRVLYMSGYNESVLGPHGVVDDGIQLLLKPFAVHELAEAVRRALDRPA